MAGVASFIPITLEQLARDSPASGLLVDRSKPCHSALDTETDSAQCIVSLFGLDINTASFAMYTFSVSVLVQALLIISMSGAADHGRYRKTFLVSFAITGAIATMLYLPVGPRAFVFGALLAIIANTCFGASFVLLNSFLPLLVRRSPSLELLAEEAPSTVPDSVDAQRESADFVSSSTALLSEQDHVDGTHESPAPVEPLLEKASLQLSTQISSNGIGIGYIAAFIVQTTAMLTIQLMGGSLLSLRTALFIVGVWWLVFTFPAAVWLRPRPGPPLQMENEGKGHLWLMYLTHSWKSLGKTVMRARRLKDLMLFLGAWFLLSDGELGLLEVTLTRLTVFHQAIATISGTAVLFAKTTLQMRPVALAMINVTVMISGMAGAFFWRGAARALGLTPLGTILSCLGLFALIPLYALLGFIPGFPLGLKSPWEMYPLGFVYGLVLGGLSSYCRSLFGSLIPPGSEAAFYALYAVTDKGSSVLGPAVVGAITDRFGEIRPAFVFLTILVITPGIVLVWVDTERGAREAKRAAEAVSGAAVDVDEFADEGA